MNTIAIDPDKLQDVTKGAWFRKLMTEIVNA